MGLRYYANTPATTLAAGCAAGDTVISVTSITGLPTSYPFTLILDRNQVTEEVVEVTAGSGTSLTVTRGADATMAFTHAAGAEVVHGVSARDVREPNRHINDTALDDHTQYALTDGSRGNFAATNHTHPAGAANVTRVVYTNGAYPARPANAVYVEWVGPSQPTVGTASGDTWVQSS